MDGQLLAAWASVVINIVLVIIAIAAIVVTYLTVRPQFEPQVLLSVKSDQSRPSLLLLVAENIGRGVALDVRFAFSKPVPSRAWGITISQAQSPADTIDRGPLSAGIPVLGPGHTRITAWGQYGGLEKALGEEPLIATIRYRGEPFGPFGAKYYTQSYPLEIRSFDATDVVDPDGARQSARELKRIRQVLERHLSKNTAPPPEILRSLLIAAGLPDPPTDPQADGRGQTDRTPTDETPQ